jgi:tRNA (guanine37-N1)-methyltransferase
MADPALRVDVLTLFPALFEGFLGESILRRAILKGLVDVKLWDLRDWAEGKHRQVDDRPFGGGPGMVLMAPPVVSAVEAVRALDESTGRLIALTPSGRTLSQEWVRELASERRLVLLCGRYEGFDERIFEILGPELLSIGDFVLSGGEVAAMVVIDAVMRLIPGVLGDDQSAVDESFGPGGGLEHPHYTRPREYRGRAVPEILLGGDHAAIGRWRIAQGRARTIDRRADLVAPGPEPTRNHESSLSHTKIELHEHEPPGEPGGPDRAGRMG